jgi:uncharacterized protein (DUF3084 family)
MTNDDKAQQPTNSDNLVLAAIQSLESRMVGMEEIIVARLNSTRPLDQQLLAKVNEMVDRQNSMHQELIATREEQAAMRQELTATREEQAAMRQELTATREEQAAMRQELTATREELTATREELAATREELAGFRAETNSNFRVVNKKLGLLSNDFLHIRAEQDLLDQRVTQLEEKKAA